MGFFNIRSLKKKPKKLNGDPFVTLKIFRKKSLTKPKKGSLLVPKNRKRNPFVLELFFVRGFGCVQNEVLSTFGKCVHGAQKHSE